jgi:hypothetical protein
MRALTGKAEFVSIVGPFRLGAAMRDGLMRASCELVQRCVWINGVFETR